jgi:hypothetical protein
LDIVRRSDKLYGEEFSILVPTGRRSADDGSGGEGTHVWFGLDGLEKAGLVLGRRPDAVCEAIVLFPEKFSTSATILVRAGGLIVVAWLTSR